MKKTLYIIVTVLLFASCNAQQSLEGQLKDGDIIFQSMNSDLSKAIELATHSDYSHVGMVYKSKEGEWMVIEAVQPVQAIPLNSWIDRGVNDHYLVMRLNNADEVLTEKAKEKMLAYGESLLGKNYDIYFEWSDERIYCSELVWKIYNHGTGISVGKAAQLKSFDLSHPLVKQKLQEHYNGKIPMDEKVVSPQAILESDKLYQVTKN